MPEVIGGGVQKPLERVMIFIDGGYIRRTFSDLFGDDNIDFFKMRNYLLHLYNATPINPFRANLIRTYYYDGIADKSEDEYTEQRRYFDSLKGFLFLTVRLGEAVKTSDGSFRQKGVDILMAIDVLTMAYRNYYDTGLFFMADRDFIPLIEAVKNAGKKTFGFSYLNNVSLELTQTFDFRYGLNKQILESWRM